MSQAVIKMEVGDEMLMKGPEGRLEYKPNMKAHIGERGRGAEVGGERGGGGRTRVQAPHESCMVHCRQQQQHPQSSHESATLYRR